ncbi:beta-ketoacyl-ACP synthase III [Luteipulveratus halotolerans]|uniref:Beta-ketoacyl-[acyl-carrier-protein] synthase III n=1 Tax=Luteipulveratus halotolerans TaxID=1631356 RepID=A0A0L6CIS3_9MICO|nr:beta-ketoacyl-ACP synthase III [Luteipulveratus halotolerans]KNX37408.1 3-oxoacyl-ACP synthase [Luteipulveratus halotolerans]
MTLQPKGTGQLASSDGARHSRIHGVGGYRPERVITNEEVCTWIDSSDEWIRQRSGVVTRRWAAEHESVVDMAEAAARPALEMAGISAAQLSAIVVATVTHPFQTPAAAPLLATRLGADGVPAFDVSAACAGYCYGISLASDMVRGGSAEYVLVIGVEKLSSITDKHDRGTSFILADGAGAAVVGPSDTPGIGPTVWGSDGTNWETISQRVGWDEILRRWDQEETTGQPQDWSDLEVAGAREASTLKMAGQTVFRWAVWSMAPVCQQALDKAGITAADLDAFIPHQANMRIIDAMLKQLKLPDDIPVARDIAETGNTSAASIPLATERMLREGEVPRGGLALQVGFGAGLVFAAQVVVLP